MTRDAQNPAVVKDADAVRKRLKAEAVAVRTRLEALVQRYEASPDLAGQRIQVLFAEMYLFTSRNWLDRLAILPDATFAYLVIPRFFALFEQYVVDVLERPGIDPPIHWSRYHWLARQLTMRSPITLHLLLLSLGVRAHVRYDLGVALHSARSAYLELFQTELPVGTGLDQVLGELAENAFISAALSYVEAHRARQTGWRFLILTIYAAGLRGSRVIWIPVLQNWRRLALRDSIEVTAPQH